MFVGHPILDEIRQGCRLRPTKTIDKSKPVILAEGESLKSSLSEVRSAPVSSDGPLQAHPAPPPAPCLPPMAPRGPPPPTSLSAPRPRQSVSPSPKNPALSKLGGRQPIDRDELLRSIRGGVRLRKVTTLDKSAPVIDESIVGERIVPSEGHQPSHDGSSYCDNGIGTGNIADDGSVPLSESFSSEMSSTHSSLSGQPESDDGRQSPLAQMATTSFIPPPPPIPAYLMPANGTGRHQFNTLPKTTNSMKFEEDNMNGGDAMILNNNTMPRRTKKADECYTSPIPTREMIEAEIPSGSAANRIKLLNSLHSRTQSQSPQRTPLNRPTLSRNGQGSLNTAFLQDGSASSPTNGGTGQSSSRFPSSLYKRGGNQSMSDVSSIKAMAQKFDANAEQRQMSAVAPKLMSGTRTAGGTLTSSASHGNLPFRMNGVNGQSQNPVVNGSGYGSSESLTRNGYCNAGDAAGRRVPQEGGQLANEGNTAARMTPTQVTRYGPSSGTTAGVSSQNGGGQNLPQRFFGDADRRQPPSGASARSVLVSPSFEAITARRQNDVNQPEKQELYLSTDAAPSSSPNRSPRSLQQQSSFPSSGAVPRASQPQRSPGGEPRSTVASVSPTTKPGGTSPSPGAPGISSAHTSPPTPSRQAFVVQQRSPNRLQVEGYVPPPTVSASEEEEQPPTSHDSHLNGGGSTSLSILPPPTTTTWTFSGNSDRGVSPQQPASSATPSSSSSYATPIQVNTNSDIPPPIPQSLPPEMHSPRSVIDHQQQQQSAPAAEHLQYSHPSPMGKTGTGPYRYIKQISSNNVSPSASSYGTPSSQSVVSPALSAQSNTTSPQHYGSATHSPLSSTGSLSPSTSDSKAYGSASQRSSGRSFTTSSSVNSDRREFQQNGYYQNNSNGNLSSAASSSDDRQRLQQQQEVHNQPQNHSPATPVVLHQMMPNPKPFFLRSAGIRSASPNEREQQMRAADDFSHWKSPAASRSQPHLDSNDDDEPQLSSKTYSVPISAPWYRPTTAHISPGNTVIQINSDSSRFAGSRSNDAAAASTLRGQGVGRAHKIIIGMPPSANVEAFENENPDELRANYRFAIDMNNEEPLRIVQR